MESKLVIFGASGGGIKVAETLKSFEIDFYCFLDNNSTKWGTEVMDKQVCSPQILLDDNYKIIIASEHQDAIEKQLEEMGQLSNLILKEDLILPAVEPLLSQVEKVRRTSENIESSIIFDLMEGVQLGGIETWTYGLARQLKKELKRVFIYARPTEMEPEEDIAEFFKYFDLSYANFKENVVMLASELLKQLPCTVVISKHTQLLYAAYLVKQLVGEQIHIISAIHSDSITFYRRQKRLEHVTDDIVCVSQKIKEKLANEFGINREQLHYKETPVKVAENLNREYTLDSLKPIKIGYAGRLVKFPKRADLLLELIKLLEERNINYQMSIAGDGSYKKYLDEYIEEKGLKDRVILKGRVPHEELSTFWREQDIFINVSDYEGMCVSMLEAMAEGAVPVSTNVAGVNEFVENSKNGFAVDMGDVIQIEEHIYYLENNRKLLPTMGEYSYMLVKEKCDVDDYTNYLLRMCI